MMETKRLSIITLCLLLTGCTTEQEDLRAWMAQESRSMVGKITPLPEIKSFPTVAYSQGDAVDPFRISRIQLETRTRVGTGPDMSRPREPLEAFPLESLRMVGTIMQDERAHALVNVGGKIHQVAVGNYLGQNHGMVGKVTETEIILNEIVEDINGDWVERVTRLLLQER